MKNQWIIVSVLSIGLSSCGGSEGSSANNSSNQGLAASLKGTSWQKECTPFFSPTTSNPQPSWNIKVKIRVDNYLQATYRTDFYRPEDTICDAVVFDAMDITNLTIAGKVFTEESIEAYKLNQNTVYNSEDTPVLPKYTIVYIDSEKLYLGQNSGENLGETPETRHSSISLDDYFKQIVNN